MKKRGMIIGIGTVLLVLGMTGLALLQVGVISPGSPGPVRTLELETPERLAGSPGQQQPSVEGKLPAPPVDNPPQLPEPATQEKQVSSPPDVKGEKPVPVPQVGKSARVYPRQDQPEPPAARQKKPADGKQPGRSVDSRQYARSGTGSIGKSSTGTASGKQPVVVKFRFDPARSRELNVARVHFGDRVVVNVRRVGKADREVYITFGIPDTSETSTYRQWAAGSRPAAVLTPVRDNDKIALTAQKQFGPSLTRKLESKQGAVLKLGARSSRYSGSRISRTDRGYYEIEMKIYSENRWNLRPRSLL